MTKKELVVKTLSGDLQDAVPSSFSIHFGSDFAYGSEAVKKHLDFFRDTDTDIIKIMNENLFPSNPGVKTSDDFRRIGPFSRKSDFIVRQTDLVKAILDKTGGDSFGRYRQRSTGRIPSHSLMRRSASRRGCASSSRAFSRQDVTESTMQLSVRRMMYSPKRSSESSRSRSTRWCSRRQGAWAGPLSSTCARRSLI